MDYIIEEMQTFFQEIYPILHDKPGCTTTPLASMEKKQVVIDALWKVIEWARTLAEAGDIYVVCISF